ESISLGLRSLDVGHNQLSGELPKSLINCTHLEFLNVEGNKINDTFPFGVSLLPHLQKIASVESCHHITLLVGMRCHRL
ncbi:hypothetical protein AALP_AAs44974U000100, partial [Arabis alpina]